MKLTVLTENMASGIYRAEHGLSYFIETDSTSLLFDTGHSDVFVHNAKLLNIDLDKVETVVLSHGHWDHGNGLRYLKDKKLICHPGCFIQRFRKNEKVNIGLELSKEDLGKRFDITESSKPYYITDTIIFLGEIPKLNPFEAKTTAFVTEDGERDSIPDDSALVIIVEDELVIVSGCAHSGICNIIEYARSITGILKVKTVIGGFHLSHDNKQTRETIKYLKEIEVEKVYPSHCTKFPALSTFYQEFKFDQVKSGMTFEFV